MLTIELPYPTVTGNHSVKHTKHGHYLTDKAKSYRKAVAEAVMLKMANKHLEGPLLVIYTISPPDLRRRDSCNLLKELKDAITKAGVWVDDSNKVIQVECIYWMEKKAGGRVVIEIAEI